MESDSSKTGGKARFLPLSPESDQFNPLNVEKQKVFSILSYNLLAEAYTFVFAQTIEEKLLDFSRRSLLAIQDIKEFSSDIICLQEIDIVHSNFYKDELEKLNYSTVFAPRPHGIPDGLIFGVKKDSFEILEHKVFQFDEKEENPTYKKGNIAIISKIKHVYHSKLFNILELLTF